ncbi:MAG: ABC transporter permease [Planctomycetota bacterium]|jgi:peptide/nickel transport system permease protein
MSDKEIPLKITPPRKSRTTGMLLLLLLLLVAFGPLLASEVPLVARVDGQLCMPAVQELFGSAPPGPGDLDWQSWAKSLPISSHDFAWSTPWPHGPFATDPKRLRAGPSLLYPLGQDDTGRDVLARILRGARPSLLLCAVGVLLAAVLGVVLGGFAGLRRGLADLLVMRLLELFLCFPMVLVLMALAALFGNSSIGVVVVFGLSMWPSFARIVRGELLTLRERDFVHAARGLGLSETRILLAHLLPQLRGPISTTAAFCMAQAVVAESTLSFLGLGPGAQSGSWGSILMQGKQSAHLGVWHLWLFPALAILSSVMLCHALAERHRTR